MLSSASQSLKKIILVILSLSKGDINISNFTLRRAQCDYYLSSFLIFTVSFFALNVFTSSTYCQLNDLKWQKADLSYQKQIDSSKRDYSFDSENAGEFLTKSLTNAYWFFISDVDGDNCPFRPTCSAFLLQSANETNIFQASLMFFDRFTRDMNIAKGHDHYPRVSDGYYYDPPENYTLNQGRIKYLPPAFIVEDE
jgi:putative component of membrane protein insertase Oxa1/YidC/SpoIIIJ protein YidD